jgi:hypothetical protein
MEENVVNTNSSHSAHQLEHDQIPANEDDDEEASSREAGGWRSIKYIIGTYVFLHSLIITIIHILILILMLLQT